MVGEARKNAVKSFDVPIFEKQYSMSSIKFKPSQFGIIKKLKPEQNMFNFGKYNGKTVAEVVQIDRGYLEWMLAQKEQNNPENEEDWIYTLKHYLGKLV